MTISESTSPKCFILEACFCLSTSLWSSTSSRFKLLTLAKVSIIAKVTRDRMMREYDKEFPVYGFKKHKGYGTKAHIEAIKNNGLCSIHRKSFCEKFI